MVAEAEVVACKKCVTVSEVYTLGNGKGNGNDYDDHQCRVVGDFGSPSISRVRTSESVSISEKMDCKSKEQVSDSVLVPSDLRYFPIICSGSYAAIGPRPYMEDKHVQMDHLSSHVGDLIKFAQPSAFYAVFDGHGGADAANFIAKNAKRFFFEDVDFPNSREVDEGFVLEVGNSLRRSFLLADQTLAEESSVSSSSGTTALTALVLGSLLMVANVGDCRAVLCRGGEAIDMSTDHRPTHPSERKRVEEAGGFVDDNYLNGILSVTRALGDWDLKFPHGSQSPLISEPEIKHSVLSEKDEFLIMACDGIWDVMSSKQAITLVRRGLRRHGEVDKCARDLVKEALRRNAYDNLTVIIVCFSKIDLDDLSPPPKRKMKCWSLSIL